MCVYGVCWLLVLDTKRFYRNSPVMSCLVLHLIILCLTTKPLRYAWHFLASSCQRESLAAYGAIATQPPSPSLRVSVDTTQDSARLDSTQFDSPLASVFHCNRCIYECQCDSDNRAQV